MNLSIKIAAIGDPSTFPEMQPNAPAEIVGLSILQSGMESGNCSAAFHFTTGDGKFYTAELSANMLIACGSAARGAKERFKDNDI